MSSLALPLRSSLPSLVFWLLITFAAAAVGAVASADAADFYGRLAQPDWAPPAQLFAPVWSVLYLMMAIAVWLVWRACRLTQGLWPYALYVAQLGVNAMWTWLFFAWHRGSWALIEILILFVLVVATMAAFRPIKPLAVWLLAPYLAWVGYAAMLTLAMWRLNPVALSGAA